MLPLEFDLTFIFNSLSKQKTIGRQSNKLQRKTEKKIQNAITSAQEVDNKLEKMKQTEAKKLKETRTKIENKVKAVRNEIRNSKLEFFCTIFLNYIYKVLHVNSLFETLTKILEVDLHVHVECKVEIHKELQTL